MVGLVIVSHSRALAEALSGLLRQVTPNSISVAIAAGIGDDRHEFGTDAVEIMEAIQSVYSEDGVLVLMDLGSAVLSAEMALEFLPDEMKSRIRFCPAPLVEGGVAAAVQISLNGDLDTVYREALDALMPKREHLGLETGESKHLPEVVIQDGAETVILTLTNLHGLHARPAAKFVQTAAGFKADITVLNLTTGKGPVSARSLNAVATLGAIENHQIQISALGAEAAQALDALKALVEANFGEDPTHSVVVAPTTISSNSGGAIPISEGVALGALFHYQPPAPPIPQDKAENLDGEWHRLQTAVSITAREISQRARQLKTTLGSEDAAIFDAHGLILQDPTLLDAARDGIFSRSENAALAWHYAVTQAADGFRALEDTYLQARAVDVEDVGRQVLFALSEKGAVAPMSFDKPVILCAPDLTPTETSLLDMKMVLGIITAGGGPTSHSAIISRALGIPAVAGVGTLLDNHPDGIMVGLNGFSAEIWVNPGSEKRAELEQRRSDWLATREKLKQASHALAVTRDGQRVEVFANLGGLADARSALENGAEGCGLLRTEFLFLTRTTAPTEEEQYSLLRQIYETMGADRPVTTRTLDVGGDKELPYVEMPQEPNPFLGVRALRLSLTRPELFMPQLRAILRAAFDLPCRIMFPMVADVSEVRRAREWVEKAHADLEAEHIPHAWPVELGIMIEIPSAALLSPVLAREVDFFSIGTNDLTQYTLAAERGNPALSHLADGLHPAVLLLIKTVADAAHRVGKWVGICGELGGDAEATAILIGLGVDELSMNAAGVPRIKAVIRDCTMEAARALAARALDCATSSEVRKLVREQ
jgi:phosphocarrier protein FPr